MPTITRPILVIPDGASLPEELISACDVLSASELGEQVLTELTAMSTGTSPAEDVGDMDGGGPAPDAEVAALAGGAPPDAGVEPDLEGAEPGMDLSAALAGMEEQIEEAASAAEAAGADPADVEEVLAPCREALEAVRAAVDASDLDEAAAAASRFEDALEEAEVALGLEVDDDPDADPGVDGGGGLGDWAAARAGM